MDERDSYYRAKLMQYTIEEKGSKDRKMLGYEAKTDLVRSYKEKEVELMEKLDKERTGLRNTKTELLALKNYARQLKYLAEDWAPPGKPMPEILTQTPPTRLDDVKTGNLTKADQVMDEENERLRKRVLRLEEEIGRLTDHLNSQGGGGSIVHVSHKKGNEFAGNDDLR